MSSLADRLMQSHQQQSPNHYILTKNLQNSSPEYINMYDFIPEDCCQSNVEFSDNFTNIINSSYQCKNLADAKCDRRKDISGVTNDILQNSINVGDELTYGIPFLGNRNSTSAFCGHKDLSKNQNMNFDEDLIKSGFYEASANLSLIDGIGNHERLNNISPDECMNRVHTVPSWPDYGDEPSSQKITGWNQLLSTINPSNSGADTKFKSSNLEKTWRSRTSSEMEKSSPFINRATPQSFDERSKFLLHGQSQNWSNSAPLDCIGVQKDVVINEANTDNRMQPPHGVDAISSTEFGRPVNLNQFTQFTSSIGGISPKSPLCKNNLPYSINDTCSTEIISSLNDEHLWLYKDPQGRIQGEFCDAQMNGWLLAGQYFTPSLRIRRKCDETFSKLSDYINLFGRVPFTAGPRIPPFQGGISQDMITKVRTLLAMQQAALFDAISANLPLNLRQHLSQSSILNSLPMKIPNQVDGENCTIDNSSSVQNQTVNLKPPSDALYPVAQYQTSNEAQSDHLQALALAQLLCTPSLNPQTAFDWSSNPPYAADSHLTSQNKSVLQDHTNPDTTHVTHLTAKSALHENRSKNEPSLSNHASSAIFHEDSVKSRSKTKKKTAEVKGLKITETRSESQSGRNSSNSSSFWARSSDSLLDSNNKSLHSVSVGGHVNEVLQNKTSSGPDEIHSYTSKAMMPKKRSRRKAGNRCVQNADVILTPALASSNAKSDTSTFNNGIIDTKITNDNDDISSTIKSHRIIENGIRPNAVVTKSAKSKKTNKSNQLTNKSSEELSSLVRWVQSALNGIELNETVDIPTFVELLTTIDAPYEVESMLVAYIGNSRRSAQFVKEFLVRRHTCWQLHRKRVEEMVLLRNPAKKQDSLVMTTNSMVLSEDVGVATHFAKSRLDNSDVQPTTESPWQQIKVKNNSGRRSKKSKLQT